MSNGAMKSGHYQWLTINAMWKLIKPIAFKPVLFHNKVHDFVGLQRHMCRLNIHRLEGENRGKKTGKCSCVVPGVSFHSLENDTLFWAGVSDRSQLEEDSGGTTGGTTGPSSGGAARWSCRMELQDGAAGLSELQLGRQMN